MKEQSVAKGFSILAASGIIVKLLSLLYIPFLLAIIGEEGNGIYAAAYQVYVLIYVISNSGIPVAISKLVSELFAVSNYKDAIRSFKIARSFLLMIGIIMTILMFILAPTLAKAIHFEKAYLAILALSPTLLFTAVASSYRGYFQGRGNMTPTAISQIIEQVINMIFTIVFAAVLLRYGIEAACAGGTIGTSLGALFSAVFLVKYQQKKDGFVVPGLTDNTKVQRYSYSKLVKKIANYSIPITFCIGMQYAGNLIDLGITKSRLIVAGFSDMEATKLFSHLYKYQQLLNAPLAITVALAATILPAISSAVAIRNKERVQNRVDFALRLCFMVTIPSAVGFAVLSIPIFELLKYGPGAYLMQIGSFALVLLALVQVQTSILQGSGRLYIVTFNLILGIIGKITANYFLISNKNININGAILGSVIGYCIPIILNFIVMKRILKIRLRVGSLLIKPFLASIIMGLVVYAVYNAFSIILLFMKNDYLINGISAMISILLGAITYFTAMFLIKGISSEDLNVMPNKLSRYIPKILLERVK
jgi:stage V sporulation protein B